MPLLRSQRCLIPTDREWFVNERGVASLSHPITIRRRYRGFTSLWPRRDSKVSTPLLRTRQNGLCSRPVFRISSLTAPLASSCLLARNRGSLSMIKRDRSLNLSFTQIFTLDRRKSIGQRSRPRGNRSTVLQIRIEILGGGGGDRFRFDRERELERELDKGGEESSLGGGSFTGGGGFLA